MHEVTSHKASYSNCTISFPCSDILQNMDSQARSVKRELVYSDEDLDTSTGLILV